VFRLAYNANGLRSIGLRDAVQAVAAAGYQGIELSLHPNHIDPKAFTKADADSLRTFIHEQGIQACCLATGADTLLGPERFEPSLIHPSKSARQQRIDLLRWAIDVAGWLEVPVVSVASGLRKPEVSSALAHDMLLTGISSCLEHAGTSVTLAIEPEPDFFIQTNVEACALIREIGSPYFRLNQDIGHANVCEDDYLKSIEKSLTLTSHIHVEDIKKRHHHHEIPGDGDIDFPEFFRIIRDGSYAGYISVELYNHSDMYEVALKRSMQHLRAMEPAACPAA
jgi:sugar phosphate isomerase/epimerase